MPAVPARVRTKPDQGPGERTADSQIEMDFVKKIMLFLVLAAGRRPLGLGLCVGVLPGAVRLHRHLLHPRRVPRLHTLQQVN